MKKLFLSLVVLLTAAHATKAEDGFSVNALTIPQGRTAELEIVFESAAAMYTVSSWRCKCQKASLMCRMKKGM